MYLHQIVKPYVIYKKKIYSNVRDIPKREGFFIFSIDILIHYKVTALKPFVLNKFYSFIRQTIKHLVLDQINKPIDDQKCIYTYVANT